MAIKQAGEQVGQGVRQGQFAYSTELLGILTQLTSTPWRGRGFKTKCISGKDKGISSQIRDSAKYTNSFHRSGSKNYFLSQASFYFN